MDALALAQNIRSEITTELMLTFGYSEKRLEQHIRKVTDYIQDDALRERAAAQLRETNQDFSMWFMGEEWWFILRDIPAEELEQMALKAQLDYLSMMVDPEL